MVPAPIRIASVGPDQDPVAEQGQVQQRYGDPLLDDHEEVACDDRGSEAADRARGDPAPVAALGEPVDQWHQGEGDQHGAEVVDRAWPARVSRLLDGDIGQRHADEPDARVDPEQPLPPGDAHEQAAEQWTGGGTDRGGGSPERHELQLLVTRGRHREQAQAAGQDRRAGRSLDHPAGDHHATGLGERDQDAGQDEQQQAELEDLLAAEHVAERPGRDDHRGADQGVPGDRPLQVVHRHPGVRADRGKQDADR